MRSQVPSWADSIGRGQISSDAHNIALWTLGRHRMLKQWIAFALHYSVLDVAVVSRWCTQERRRFSPYQPDPFNVDQTWTPVDPACRYRYQSYRRGNHLAQARRSLQCPMPDQTWTASPSNQMLQWRPPRLHRIGRVPPAIKVQGPTLNHFGRLSPGVHALFAPGSVMDASLPPSAHCHCRRQCGPLGPPSSLVWCLVLVQLSSRLTPPLVSLPPALAGLPYLPPQLGPRHPPTLFPLLSLPSHLLPVHHPSPTACFSSGWRPHPILLHFLAVFASRFAFVSQVDQRLAFA